MRLSFGTAALTLAAACVAITAEAQQSEPTPFAAPTATGIGVPLPGAPSVAEPSPPAPAQAAPQPARPSRQIAEQPSTSLTTQDCVRMPTPAEKTDCLNQLSSDGNYMPTPVPAPGTQMPMEFRLPLGKREIPPPP